MAGWADLFEARPLSVPKQVFLATGELSTLVWDYVHACLEGYDFYLRVENVEDLSYSIAGMGSSVAYLLVSPTPEVLQAAERVIRKGGTEAIFLLVEGDGSQYPKVNFEYVKKKAQQFKNYYTLTVPKAEQARAKMVAFFLLRWGVARETSQRVCSALEYSPGQMYTFDRQFLACTEGAMLPSSRTQGLVEELLGSDSASMVVSRIASGQPIDTEFDEAFTSKVLRFLHGLIIHARMIQGAWKVGETTLSSVSKATGLTQFLVMRAMGMAEAYEPKVLRRCEDLVLMSMDNVTGNPDVLSVLSRVWGH